MNLTIRHLKIFITVYDERSMTKAAKKLFMTQPSISQVIKELENYYNVILFERLSHKLYVTKAGEKLYTVARQIINLLDEAKDTLGIADLQKNLAIGVNYTIGSKLVHRYIQKYERLYPGSEISVNVNKAPKLIEMLRNGELDLALIEERDNEADLIQKFFYHDRVVIIANPKHALCQKKYVNPEDIINEHLLLRDRGAGVRNLFELRMKELGLGIKPYWESTSTTALISATENNFGIAVLPFQLVQEKIDNGSLKEIKIKGMDLDRKLMIAYHKNKFLTSSMLEFVKVCHQTEEIKSLQLAK